ncbi:hypothetical protein ABIC83_006012 [Roseateles asaccharophilus]
MNSSAIAHRLAAILATTAAAWRTARPQRSSRP